MEYQISHHTFSGRGDLMKNINNFLKKTLYLLFPCGLETVKILIKLSSHFQNRTWIAGKAYF